MSTAPTPNEALCINGDPRSGKTTALAERAAAWAAGRSPRPQEQPDFLFFCAFPRATETAARLLADRGMNVVDPACGSTAFTAPAGDGPRGLVTTPFDYALRILADPRARALTGRNPRVLSRDEEATFFEDLKTSGLKRRRLRELWAFLQCGWANLNDDDPAWIKTTEEQAQLDLARAILAFDDALLSGEVVNLAVRVLRKSPTLRRDFGAPVVLADDYPLMSRASQSLACLLATEKIVVAGDPEPAPPAFEPYPCAAGLDEFFDAHAPAQRVTLDTCEAPAQLSWSAAEDLPSEMRLIATTVAKALEDGTPAERIAVVGTNRIWRANLLQALTACGIPAAELRPTRQGMPGGKGPRDTEATRSRVLAQLAADPDDSAAWRQWLSFGDPLARSAAVSELRAVGPSGLSLAEALRRLDAGTLEGMAQEGPFARSLLASYREALRQLGDMAPNCAHEEAAIQTKLSAREDVTQDDTASASPCDRENDLCETVVVAAPEDLFGRTFDLVIFGGFVNGFIPSREMCDPGVIVGAARERAEAADRAVIRLAQARAAKRLLFTSFETCPLETAESLNLSIARIALRNGHRLCTINPSNYLEELVPSGQERS